MEHPKTFYLIDDDSDDLDFFSDAVKMIDPSIVCIKATNSDAALTSFRTHDAVVPDLIFLDLNMPVVDGRKMLAELKSIKPYAHVPVIIYTTSSHPKDIEDTRLLGAAGFLTKPYRMEELVHELSEIITPYYQGVSFVSADK